MDLQARPDVRFGDLPSDEHNSIESGSDGGAPLHPPGSMAKVSFKTMGLNSTLSKNAVTSSESSYSVPSQIAQIELSHRENMSSEPNENGQDEKQRVSHAPSGKVRVQGSGISKLNPTTAEFKPTSTRKLETPMETSLRCTFSSNPSTSVFDSSDSLNSDLTAEALECPSTSSATFSAGVISRDNQTFADQSSAVKASRDKLQQGQVSQFFSPTNIVSQVNNTFGGNEDDIHPNMADNFQSQAAQRQAAPQANLQHMQQAQVISQANLQHTFATHPVPRFYASGTKELLNDTHRDNSAAFDDSIRRDIMQQHGAHGLQRMPMGMSQHGQSLSLPSVPASHEQAAMSALQAHLSRVEAEQAVDTQSNQAETYHFQTPVRSGTEKSSTPRMTPSSYRLTPRSGLTSANLFSPSNTHAGGMLPRTEPRNFAPRNNGYFKDEQPPRFDIQTSMPVHHTKIQGVTAAPQRYGGSHDSSASLQQQQGPGIGSVMSPSGPGGDPFSSSTAMVKYGESITNLIRPTQSSLSHVIKPIEPLSTALAMQNHPVPDYIRRQRSRQLNELTAAPNARPTAEAALCVDNFPFIEGARCAQPSQNHGVVKIKNIPFAVTRSEIIAFLGRNSKILNDTEEPVHIIMERVTSKTNDAYIEFMSPQGAVAAVDRYQKNIAMGRHARLGDRPVEIELSSQSSLMKDLFPLAKGVRWDGARPVILQDHPTEPWSCFKGFITEEEMTMLVKHVESPFSKDCPQRPFESMISTLRKFPWYMTDRITVRQRHAVYEACVSLLRCLQWAMKERKHEGILTPQLYRRLWTSGMLCHGFTVTMRDSIASIVDLPEHRMREFNMPQFGEMWRHIYSLVPKPGSPLDLIEWYIAIIREETHRTLACSLPNIQAEIHKDGMETCLYWGFIFKEMPLPRGEAFDNMTLAEMANREFTVVTNILQRALSQ